MTLEEVKIFVDVITKAVDQRLETRFAAFGPDVADAQARALAAEARCGTLEVRCRELGDRVLQLEAQLAATQPTP